MHTYYLAHIGELAQEIGGIYRPSSRVATPARISLRRESFSLTASPAADATLPVNDIIIPGTLINKNTAEVTSILFASLLR